MRHTTWRETLGYYFSIDTEDRWLSHHRNYLSNEIGDWLIENVGDREFLRGFIQNRLAYIAFKKKEDLLLFVMRWT